MTQNTIFPNEPLTEYETRIPDDEYETQAEAPLVPTTGSTETYH